MSEFEIETGLEIPPKTRTAKYPWKDMEIGDSFFVPQDGRGRKPLVSNLCACAKGYARRLGAGIDFSVRSVKEDGRGEGVRVWRTA